MKIFKLAIISLLFFTHQLYAQSYGNFDKVPFAIGLFPPINTNGSNAGNCINQVSLNLISGYSGGLSGIEFAGLTNTERDFVRGVQFAGFGNFVNGEFTGFQFAGFTNFNRNITRGFQFAGFANIVKGDGKVFQLAGLSNITMGNVNGSQLAGFLNYSKEKMEKLQIAGVVNIAQGDVKGLQLAGLTNIANGDLDGSQIAGFLNVAKNIDGFQLGVINIADTIQHGVPIGVLSIVRDGFHEFEISAGKALNTQVAFKIGVDQFYNIFAAGTQYFGPEFMWGVGYGIGTHLIQRGQFKTQLELMSFHINEGSEWTNSYNDLQQIKLNFSKKISDHTAIFVAPTINLLITDKKMIDGKPFESRFAPYSLYSHSGDHTTLKGWIGLTAGIHFN